MRKLSSSYSRRSICSAVVLCRPWICMMYTKTHDCSSSRQTHTCTHTQSSHCLGNPPCAHSISTPFAIPAPWAHTHTLHLFFHSLHPQAAIATLTARLPTSMGLNPQTHPAACVSDNPPHLGDEAAAFLWSPCGGKHFQAASAHSLTVCHRHLCSLSTRGTQITTTTTADNSGF